MRKIYPALLTQLEDGSYLIRIPDVSGCVTTAPTIEEALDNINDALSGCLCTLEDFDDPIPVASSPASIAEEGSTVVLVDVNTMTYRLETDTRAVRKNVSMPAWLSYMADQRGINCSQVLQDALKRQLNLAT